MNRKKPSQGVIGLSAIILLLIGCGVIAPAQPTELATSTPISQSSAPTAQPVEDTPAAVATSTPISQSSAPTDYVLVPMDCIVFHSGWEGIVVAPGVTKPTSGIVVAFTCNGKDVEIADKTIADGYIETRDFGRMGIRFRSQAQTIGAGEYMKIAEGYSLPEPSVETYILSSMLTDFTNQYSK